MSGCGVVGGRRERTDEKRVREWVGEMGIVRVEEQVGPRRAIEGGGTGVDEGGWILRNMPHMSGGR